MIGRNHKKELKLSLNKTTEEEPEKIIKKKKGPLSIKDMVFHNLNKKDFYEEKTRNEKEKFKNKYKDEILVLANEAFNNSEYRCEYINIVIFGDPNICAYYKRAASFEAQEYKTPYRREIIRYNEEMYNCISHLGKIIIPELIGNDDEGRVTLNIDSTDKKATIKIDLRKRVNDE